ncbi:hypothetical protein B0H14DRAFT_1127264 [Mycena olivaceomarginata]|nr:hypothetical protein B0H14DRAFT_2850798 [Mycena olivaceomarginata]KAJ7836073.1 hypothetical protein B0H14DRAFT_1127264 [Mycena olivaceomarginata]
MSLIPRPPPTPTPPPQVVSLLHNNDAPDASEISIVEDYISSRERHFTLWKTSHIDSLPPDSSRFIEEHDNATRSLYELNRRGGPTIVVMQGPFDRMPPAIAQLIRERDRLDELVRKYRSILSPVRRLPVELISKILRLVPPRTFGPSPYEQEYPPWRLTRISSRWRACAVGDPSLWTKVSIHGDVLPRNFQHIFPLAMLRVQLALSKGAPLDIHFNWRYFDEANAHLLALMDIAIDHCCRWDRLVLEGDVNIPSYFSTLSRIKSQLPRLRRLEAYLDINWFNPPRPGGVGINFFADAPALREVILAKPRLGSSNNAHRGSVALSVPWEQVTKYRARLDVDAHLGILRRAQGLRECGLLFLNNLNIVHGEHIQLLALHRLHVEDSSFLDILTTPSVVELIVNGTVESVLPFLHRSTAQLTSLTLIDWEPSLKLLPILRSCPALTHLCIAVAPDIQKADVDVLVSVLQALEDADLCPSLTSVFWHDETDPKTMSGVYVDYQDALHALVTARRQGKLASLRVFLDSAHWNDPRVQRFQSAQYEGFDVRVSGRFDMPSFLETVNPP